MSAGTNSQTRPFNYNTAGAGQYPVRTFMYTGFNPLYIKVHTGPHAAPTVLQSNIPVLNLSLQISLTFRPLCVWNYLIWSAVVARENKLSHGELYLQASCKDWRQPPHALHKRLLGKNWSFWKKWVAHISQKPQPSPNKHLQNTRKSCLQPPHVGRPASVARHELNPSYFLSLFRFKDSYVYDAFHDLFTFLMMVVTIYIGVGLCVCRLVCIFTYFKFLNKRYIPYLQEINAQWYLRKWNLRERKSKGNFLKGL